MSERPSYPPEGTEGESGGRTAAGTPRWVYVSVLLLAVLVGAFVVLHLIGGGIGGHTP